MLKMNSRIFHDTEIKIVKGCMDIVILKRLRDVPSSGYDIVAYIHRKNKFHISPCIIYSALYRLEREELVRGIFTSNKRIYNITQKGLNYVNNVLSKRKKYLN
ncbi:MAG: PadR family transcriptional regulator [Candidatus Bathyarchaeia archaeon]